MHFSKRQIVKYAVLPEFFPRIMQFFGSGFIFLAYVVALVFHSVRLLPDGHPYLMSENFGRFGIRHVIAQASQNIKFNRNNLDQIVIFFSILAGIVILLFQFILIAFALTTQHVYAGSTFTEWFTFPTTGPVTNGYQDIALVILDTVFGAEGIFNSCVSLSLDASGNPLNCLDHHGNIIPKSSVYPYPMHTALHELFRFYSIGISILSLMIIIYYITTIVGETAATGTAFGMRFNRAWAPVRLILFFALIAPLNLPSGPNAGLNGAQLITLWTAKFGSVFATNAWFTFNDATARTWYNPENLIAIPPRPHLNQINQFWSTVHGCIYGHKKAIDTNSEVKIYVVRSNDEPIAINNINAAEMDPTNGAPFNGSTAFQKATQYTGGDVTIRIGIRDIKAYPDELGNVYPVCGELQLPQVAFYDHGNNPIQPGPAYMQEGIFQITVLKYLDPSSTSAFDLGKLSAEPARCFVDRIGAQAQQACTVTSSPIYADAKTQVISVTNELLYGLGGIYGNAISRQMQFGDFSLSDEILQRGWGGAAIWYNRIARMNGELASASIYMPVINKWPLVMELTQEQQLKHSKMVTGVSRFSAILPDGNNIKVEHPFYSAELATALQKSYKFWQDIADGPQQERAGINNPIIDAINAIFGTTGLFNIRATQAIGSPVATADNREVIPLALLSSLGKGLIDAAVVHFGVVIGGSIGEGMLGILNSFSGAKVGIKTASTFVKAVAQSIIVMGAVLYYVLPFLPFVYFLFAISGWIKSIFEAMVAMPLWALAHLRIDGEGLPGPGASNGYFILLEIFIRPILIFMGLMASILIFSALVQTLNEVFDLVVENVSGSYRNGATSPDYRGAIDEFFYTIIYTVIVYMMAISSFKLIDSIPNQILRWMNVSVLTIQENAGDPASTITQGVYQKGNMTVSQLSGTLDGGKASLFMS